MNNAPPSYAMFDEVDTAVAEAYRLETSAPAWAKAGTALLRAGHLSEAAECIRNGLDADERCPEALFAMGQLHIEWFDEGAAITMFQAVKAIRPNDLVVDGYLRLLSSVPQCAEATRKGDSSTFIPT
jgi:tetratricopeptide (TPR) repeat protein